MKFLLICAGAAFVLVSVIKIAQLGSPSSGPWQFLDAPMDIQNFPTKDACEGFRNSRIASATQDGDTATVNMFKEGACTVM